MLELCFSLPLQRCHCQVYLWNKEIFFSYVWNPTRYSSHFDPQSRTGTTNSLYSFAFLESCFYFSNQLRLKRQRLARIELFFYFPLQSCRCTRWIEYIGIRNFPQQLIVTSLSVFCLKAYPCLNTARKLFNPEEDDLDIKLGHSCRQHVIFLVLPSV